MVRVKMIDIAWIYTNKKSFLNFATIVNREDRVDLFMTDFVQVMTNVFWPQNKWLIFWRVFVPYVAYLSFSLFYWVNIIC